MLSDGAFADDVRDDGASTPSRGGKAARRVKVTGSETLELLSNIRDGIVDAGEERLHAAPPSRRSLDNSKESRA